MRIFLISIITLLFIGCNNSSSGRKKTDIIIFHAGSLSVPLSQIKEEYEKIHPDINILLEPDGSLVCIRKITELKKDCDIIASADYFIINDLLIPEFTGWNIRFATNELVIAFNDNSNYSKEINADNWFDILLRDDVVYGRSDPDTDPCGYRTVLLLKLAEKYYIKDNITSKLTSKNREFIRPKSVDLISQLESNNIDYIFEYKSVAIQHGFQYVKLPNEINLSDPSMKRLYQSVFLEVNARKPGEMMRIYGDYICYGISVLDNAPEREAAIDFIDYMMGEEGRKILEKNGQNPFVPPYVDNKDNIPDVLSKYLLNK